MHGEWTYELLKHGGEAMHKLLLGLVQLFFALERVPEELRLGDIVIAFKDGDRRQPLDYRPLTLLNVVGKLYCTILAARLSKAAEQIEAVLSNEQGGFRAGRSQSDQLYILLETVRMQRNRKRGMYALFVDIKKAYDRVHRPGLWLRLWQCGAQSKNWRVLQNLYEDVQSRIRINESDTEWFELAEGLRQGCVLSPLLYAIFINSLADMLKASAAEGTVNGVRLSENAMDQLLLLLFADDIVLVSESLTDLQNMADKLAVHAKMWRYEVNLRKTKYMYFNEARQYNGQAASTCVRDHVAGQTTLVWDGGQPIKRVSQYKYLGIHLHEKLKWTTHKRYVLNKTADAAETVRRKGIYQMQPRQATYIWTWPVRCCAEYAVDVWCAPADEWNDLERVQVDVARNVLRVDRASKHDFVRGELGWMRLVTRRHLSRLRYLWRLLTMSPTRWPARLFRLSLGLDAGETMGADCFDQAAVQRVSGSWTAVSLRLVARLNLDGELVRLQQLYERASTIAITDAERQ